MALQSPENVDIRGGRIARLRFLSAYQAEFQGVSAQQIVFSDGSILTKAEETAAEILAKILTVDGVGSGLDAATLLAKTWASPDPIGSGTPNTGKFSNLQATAAFRSQANNGGILAKESAAVVAGGNIQMVGATRGLCIFSNQTNSNTSLLLFDAGTGALVIVSETTAGKLVNADPGAATSKFWVSFGGGGAIDLVFTNRWAASQAVQVTVISNAGTLT